MSTYSADRRAVSISASEPRAERADASRNRARVLDAAARLFARHGVADVTMDDVASEAGVGKGTLYRRFGDKGGLATALLGERESELQHQMLSGPPPLGPGSDPVVRLIAFSAAYLRFAVENIDLLEMSETNAPGARFRTGAYALWVAHCRILLERSGADDAELRAQVLMAALSAEQIRRWTEDQALAFDELTRMLAELIRSLARAVS